MITLTFTQEQMQVLNEALSNLPFKFAAPLVNDINKQIQEQQNMVKEVGNES